MSLNTKIKTVEELIADGAKVREACRKAGVNYNTFYSSSPVRRRDYIASQVPLMKKLRAEGYTLREIARQVGLSPSTVSRYLILNGMR